MIEPMFHYVLLKYENIYDLDPAFVRAKKAGIALAEDHEDAQRRNAGIDKGTVVAFGPTAFEDCKGKIKPGDRVGFQKHTGKLIIDEKDETKYIMINDEDIQYIQR